MPFTIPSMCLSTAGSDDIAASSPRFTPPTTRIHLRERQRQPPKSSKNPTAARQAVNSRGQRQHPTPVASPSSPAAGRSGGSTPPRYGGETRDTGHETRDTRRETRDTRHGTRDTRYGTRDTRYGTRDTGHGTRDTGHGTLCPARSWVSHIVVCASHAPSVRHPCPAVPVLKFVIRTGVA
jgi:hypothetical protein